MVGGPSTFVSLPSPELLSDFLNQFDYWDSGSANDPTSSSDAPTAAYYMPKSAAQQQGLVYVTGEGNFREYIASMVTL